jgi:hypothetical protein
MAVGTIGGVSTLTSDVYAIPAELADLRDMIRRLAQEKITPTVASSMPETVAVTANFRIAPSAMRNIDVPMPMAGCMPARRAS